MDEDNWSHDIDDKLIEIINKHVDTPKPEVVETFTDTSECICIEDIMSKRLDNLSSNELIQYECTIAYWTQVLMEGTKINKIRSSKTYENDLSHDKLKDIISYLKWISNVSQILAKRIGQELLVYKSTNSKPPLIRSSYNFCVKYTQCKNFYSKYEAPTCKEHHYVHSFLKYDVDSVIDFLNYYINNNVNITQSEINNLYLSIKTICFVTKHMYKEINYVHDITKNNSEEFHRNNPIDMSKKNKPWIVNKYSSRAGICGNSDMKPSLLPSQRTNKFSILLEST